MASLSRSSPTASALTGVYGVGVRERERERRERKERERERERTGYERFALHKHNHPAILGGEVKVVGVQGVGCRV